MIYKAPTEVPFSLPLPKIFLAGSIEMGKAVDWQKQVEQELDGTDVIIMNPRRDDWDSTWVQSRDNPQFRQQVEWELQCQERADLILMNFVAGLQAPITLLELGLFVKKPLVVHCPEGFWRKGNVDIVLERYGATEATSIDHMISMAKAWLDERRRAKVGATTR